MSHHIKINLGYRDPRAAMEFLVSAFGFERGKVYEGDDGEIRHAQVVWPPGEVVQIHEGSEGCTVADLTARSGSGYPGISMHVDVENFDPLYERAVASGATVVRELQDSPAGVGTRGFIVADPEGLYWSFGTPLPELIRTEDGRWVPRDDTG
jgi:uncharacterized glyoxalase superfamily protein PhnB